MTVAEALARCSEPIIVSGTDPVHVHITYGEMWAMKEAGALLADEVRRLREQVDIMLEANTDLAALRERHAKELADEQRKVRIALLMVKKSEAELAEIKGQTCATCRHSYTPLSVMLACCLTKDDAGDGLSCETFGHRCGAWARREP